MTKFKQVVSTSHTIIHPLASCIGCYVLLVCLSIVILGTRSYADTITATYKLPSPIVATTTTVDLGSVYEGSGVTAHITLLCSPYVQGPLLATTPPRLGDITKIAGSDASDNIASAIVENFQVNIFLLQYTDWWPYITFDMKIKSGDDDYPDTPYDNPPTRWQIPYTIYFAAPQGFLGDRVPCELDFQLSVRDAVPEPSSLVLFAFGALSLLGYTWRQRAKAAAEVITSG